MKKVKSAVTALLGTLMTAALMTGCATSPTLNGIAPNVAPATNHSKPSHHAIALRTLPLHAQATYQLTADPQRVRPDFYVDLNKHIYYSDRVMVVSFHDMSLHLKSPYNMSPVAFGEDLQALQQYHFNVISNQQFTDWLDHGYAVPDNAVLLTFDDGYQSMYTHTLPILRSHHMTGTFFIITHAQDVHYPGFMSWPEVQALANEGMTVESHTYDLHYDVNVNGKLIPAFDTAFYKGHWQTPTQYFQRDYQDFLTARLQLQQHVGQPVSEIAWPYGYGNMMAYRAAQAAGYHYFFTTAAGVDSPSTSSWYIRRIDVGLASTPQQVLNEIFQVSGSPAVLVPVKQVAVAQSDRHSV
ncbi:polysaccharide deacetylase family protein [Alicyclobacillaceae bacterium I2511]|nr:polysaccharide deacetylase family protein [Alicyclobacillaceae bacterium I2511]